MLFPWRWTSTKISSAYAALSVVHADRGCLFYLITNRLMRLSYLIFAAAASAATTIVYYYVINSNNNNNKRFVMPRCSRIVFLPCFMSILSFTFIFFICYIYTLLSTSVHA